MLTEMTNFTGEFMNNLIHEISFYGIIFICFFIATNLLTKFVGKIFVNNNIINYSLIKQTTRPIYYMFLYAFLFTIASATLKSLDVKTPIMEQTIKYIPLVKSLFITFFITLSLLNFINSFKKNTIITKKSSGMPIDLQKIDMLSKLCSIVVLCLATISIMQIFGLGFGALATVGGLSGIIVGFSTKDLFANFFGLFSIYLDKPFIIGDEITILDKKISGYVEEIGLRITTLRTSNNSTVVYLPNSIFNTMIIENNSRINNKIFVQDIKISHYGKVDIFEKLVEKLPTSLKSFAFVNKEENPRVKISYMESRTATLNFKILFNPVNGEKFILQSNMIFHFLYTELEKNGLSIISNEERILIKETSNFNQS